MLRSLALAAVFRCAKEDLDKERGPVMEEFRSAKDAGGRASESHWKLMLEGSKVSLELFFMECITVFPIKKISSINEDRSHEQRSNWQKNYSSQFWSWLGVILVVESECVYSKSCEYEFMDRGCTSLFSVVGSNL